MSETVHLSLISHTNVGKTTLARTLLRADVGEVLDQAHVTESAEPYRLIEADGHRLELWDTPGFGDSARMMKLLRREREPLGWLLHQVWDRMMDRPLWSTQRAVRHVKERSDVVLYLVNAAEEPEDAGYVPLELELLTWIGRPVLLLLNQVGPDDRDAASRWARVRDEWPIVKAVLPLDAFSRCWVEESVLLDRVAELLEEPRRGAMRILASAWNRRNAENFDRCVGAMSACLARVAVDREIAPSRQEPSGGAMGAIRDALKFSALDKRRAMKAINARVDVETARMMARMIEAHGLEGESAARIERRVQDFEVRGEGIALNERSGALAGAVVSGALSGLAADVLAGGLTLGGGMIAGGILGAVGGFALGKGYRLVGLGETPSVKLSPEFLDRFARQVMLRYLAVAHFGRGRGRYRDLAHPARWSDSVERSLESRRGDWEELWRLADGEPSENEPRLRQRLVDLIGGTLRDVLDEAYPEVGR